MITALGKKLLSYLLTVLLFSGLASFLIIKVNGASFQNLGPRGAWFTSFAFDPGNPDIVYAGADTGMGVYKSIDGGITFTYTSSSLPNISGWTLAIDPNDSTHQTIYAGDFYGYGAYMTTNGGGQWTTINTGFSVPNPPNRANDRIIHVLLANAIDPSVTKLFAFTDNGFYRYDAITGGFSWSRRGQPCVGTDCIPRQVNGQPNDLVVMARNSSGCLFVGGRGGKLYRSGDKGETWQLLADYSALTPSQQINDLYIDPSNDNLYVVTIDGDPGQVRIYLTCTSPNSPCSVASCNPSVPTQIIGLPNITVTTQAIRRRHTPET